MAEALFWSGLAYDEGEEFARSVKISLLGVTPGNRSSFLPSEDTLEADWLSWCDLPFSEVIGPVFRDTFDRGTRLELREVAELDFWLAEQLHEASSDLQGASLPFIEGKSQMRGHREWSKYIQMVQSGKAPGHLPVIFALHSVLFRMPLANALQAYAWFEWKTGHRSIGKSRWSGDVHSPPPLFLSVKPHIVRLLSSEPEEGDEDLNLRVV